MRKKFLLNQRNKKGLSQHTVDCLQTIGVCRQTTVPLSSIDRMFVFNHPYVFFNQPDVF